MNSITASQLRTEGVAAIKKQLVIDWEAVITVQGKDKFVVMSMERYNSLREYELDAALNETKINHGK